MADIQFDTRHTASTRQTTTVVVGVDGSAGSVAAVRWAADHARAIGARLQLIHAASQ